MHKEGSERRKKTCSTQATFGEAVPEIVEESDRQYFVRL